VVLQVVDHILLLLLPGEAGLTRQVGQGLVSVAAPGMRVQSGQVGRHLQAVRRLHVPSFRCALFFPLLPPPPSLPRASC